MRKHTDKLPGGLADEFKPSDFDPKELELGIDDELEHTNNRAVAQEIAMDHLRSNPKYYTDLKKIEKTYHKLKDKYQFGDFTISIETPKGEYRHWYDPFTDSSGKTKMTADYGYFTYSDEDATADGDKLDVFIGADDASKKVYVVHQMKGPDFKQEDELKVLLGMESPKQAKMTYLENYTDDRFFGRMDELTVDEFKDKYVNKAFPSDQGNPVQQPGQFGQNPQMMDPMLMIDPYDMNNPDSIQMQLRQIASAKDKELIKLSKVVWGDGYDYKGVSEDYIRNELCGFLLDQKEYLDLLNPMYQEMKGQSLATVAQLPHQDLNSRPSSESAGIYQNGQNNSEDPSNSMNYEQEELTQTRSSSSNNMESSQFPTKKPSN